MINLYIIDYYNQKSGGLTTYLENLLPPLFTYPQYTVNLILVNSKVKSEFCSEFDGKKYIYHFPDELCDLRNLNKSYEFAIYLKGKLSHQSNIIFHFNWINHTPFARFLKEEIPCKTLLTKHCIPWRDSITTNYPFFLKMNAQFESNVKTKYINNSLTREFCCYDGIDHIICVTEFGKKSLINMFLQSEKKISTIYNGINEDEIVIEEKDMLRKSLGFSQNEKILLFAGSLSERKGIYDLLAGFKEIVNKYPNIRLLIAGSGNFTKIIKEFNGIWSKVSLLGNHGKTGFSIIYCT